jgi:hypothetical protein
MNSRDWKAKGCVLVSGQAEAMEKGSKYFVTFSLQSRGRYVRQAQSPFGSALGIGEDESVS